MKNDARVVCAGVIFVLGYLSALDVCNLQQPEVQVTMDKRYQGSGNAGPGKSVKPDREPREEQTDVPEDQPVKTIPIGTPASREELERLKREAVKPSVPPQEGAQDAGE